MSKRKSNSDSIKLPKIYKDCHYHPDDIITKFCVDNRTYPSKQPIEEQVLPRGFNNTVFDNLGDSGNYE